MKGKDWPHHAKPPPQKLSKRRLRHPLKRKKNERKRLAPARKTFAHAARGRHIAYTKLASKSSRNLALEYRLRKPPERLKRQGIQQLSRRAPP